MEAAGRQCPGAGSLLRCRRLTESQWAPQGNWQTLAGDGFTVSYPGNWKAVVSGASGLIAPPGGIGAQDEVGYGMLSGRFQPLAAGRNRRRNGSTGRTTQAAEPAAKPGRCIRRSGEPGARPVARSDQQRRCRRRHRTGLAGDSPGTLRDAAICGLCGPGCRFQRPPADV